MEPSDVTALKGDNVSLWCVADSGEPVNWEHVGHDSLPPSAKVLPSDLLVLERVGSSEEGVYRCSVGDASVDATVTVVGKMIRCGSTTAGHYAL